MYLKELYISNFKSIKEAKISFSPLTVIVGANAAGKSNLISVFRFLSNILTRGIDTAVALEGGMEFLANANLEKGTPIKISFSLDLGDKPWFRKVSLRSAKNVHIHYQSIRYAFTIRPYKRGNGYQVASEDLEFLCEYGLFEEGRDKNKEFQLIGKMSVSFARTKRSAVRCSFDVQEAGDNNEEFWTSMQSEPIYDFFKYRADRYESEMMFSFVPLLLPPSFAEEHFIRIYDFDPRQLKQSCPIASVPFLEADGANIASVLQPILSNKRKYDKLIRLLSRFLPFAQRISVESNMDKSLTYTVKERYGEKPFRQYFLSDGTVSILAILVALYFEEKTEIAILEEPERNLHPKLLEDLLTCAEDISSEKQVILTTHNPELLKYAKIEHILLISRDGDGFSCVSSPKDSETVRAFVQEELGLDDLFLQDLLGA